MNMFKNQKGVSLVEALVAIGITSAAGVAYMTHTQTVAKNEAKQKVKGSIDLLNAQAVDYLKSREVCNENISKAFGGIALNSSSVKGDQDYKALKNKGFKDASGATQARNIFAVGDVFDGGRVYISDISYELSDLQNINQQSSPWTKSGKIKISVGMETCKDGGPVVFKNAQTGVLTDRCAANQRVKTFKSYDKFAAFKTKPNGIIDDVSIKEKVLNANGQWQWVTVGTKKNLACADSQDALVEAAAQYTDIKVCMAQIKMLMVMRKSGKLDCGLELKVTDFDQKYMSTIETIQIGPPIFHLTRQVPKVLNTTISLPSGSVFFKDSFQVEVLGAGGSGACGAHSGAGNGGKAGIFKKQILPIGSDVSSCTITAGAAGQGRGSSDDRGCSGNNGGESKITCGSISLVASGGAGGDHNRPGSDHNCGLSGANSLNNLGEIIGNGSGGHCRTSTSPNNAGPGAGGGAAGERYNMRSNEGGVGLVKVKYSAFEIIDANDMFNQAGISKEEFIQENNI